MGGLLLLVQQGVDWAGPSAVPNVSVQWAHPSSASVPTSYHLMWRYNCLWTLKSEIYDNHVLQFAEQGLF